MVLPVRDEDVAGSVDGDPLEPLELAVALAPAPEGPEEGAVRVEYLNSVVARVSDKDEPLLVDSYTPWEFKLSFICSFRAKGRENLSIHIEYLKPVIVGVGNDHPVGVGNGDVVG